MASNTWKCPHCGALRRKSDRLESYDGFRVVGVSVTAKCLGCGGPLELTALIAGAYDHAFPRPPRFSKPVHTAIEILTLAAIVAIPVAVFKLLGGSRHWFWPGVAAFLFLAMGFILGDLLLRDWIFQPAPTLPKPEVDVEVVDDQPPPEPPPEAPLSGAQEVLVRLLIEAGRPRPDSQGASVYLTSAAKEARRIGERLHELGGHELMLRAHAEVAQALSATAGRELEAVWDGIGDWRG